MFDALFTGDALWFSTPALVGTGIFLVRVLLMLVGGDADGDVAAADVSDLDVSGGVDLDGHDSTAAFEILSVQGVAAFAAGFGWGGVGGHLGLGWGLGASGALGLFAGFSVTWFLGLLLKGLHDLQSSGTVTLDDAIGATGDVYASIPGRGHGRGQVKLVLRDRLRIVDAVSDDRPLDRSTRIRVLGVNDDNTLTVTPA